MNAGELFNSIATVGGVVNADAVKTLLENEELKKLELPKEISDTYQTKFLTRDNAKTDPELTKHFQKIIYSEALSPVDKKLETAMEKYGFSDEQKEAVMKADGTFKRLDKFNEYAATITSSFTSVTDKKKFQNEIERLNKDLTEKDNKHQAEVKKITDEWTVKFSEQFLNNKFLEKPLFTSDTQTIDDTILLAKNKLNKYLAEKKAAWVFDPQTGNFKIVQADNKEIAYTENHKEVSFNDIRDKVLADNKLLKVTTTTTSRATGNNNNHNTGDDKPPSLREMRYNQNVNADLENFNNAPKQEA